jgi:hypothetical protein
VCGSARLSVLDWCENSTRSACTPGFGYWEDGYIDCPRVNSPSDGRLLIDSEFSGHDFSASREDDGQQCFEVYNQGQGIADNS